MSIFDQLRRGDTISMNEDQNKEILEASSRTIALIKKLNNAVEQQEIRAILSQITDTEIDKSVSIFTPLFINYGKNIKIGKNVFINFNCTFLDIGGITIDDGVLIAPNVNILSEGHPISSADRHSLKTKPIHIKKNAWIGAGAIILQGVTIGENAIVGAGSVVSKDVPDNTVVVGSPARVVKKLEP